ncbi:unnamed protein product [Blepharisma stoltei]|uniref:Cyclin n=1 Tax=Blepharisma stoltei TaxID=1481888 RepID=A0AAU9J8F5_9CILI|nr:unnamed protein product [Blepharisma stoltei]
MSIIEAVTCMLETYLEQTAINNSPKTSSLFFSKKVPNISISSYLSRLKQYMKCSEECYILALIYIDRITSKHRSFTINTLCIHRLILTSVMVSAKFAEDTFYKNSYYAKVGGIPCSEMNMLEHQFLMMIEFELFVSDAEFNSYSTTLISHFGLSQNELTADTIKNDQGMVKEGVASNV